MNLEQVNNVKFMNASLKAAENGFILEKFTGFVLLEIESGADLYFGNLDDLDGYLNVCQMTEEELKAHYAFVTDSEIDGEFDQKRAKVEKKINQGAKLTNHKMSI